MISFDEIFNKMVSQIDQIDQNLVLLALNDALLEEKTCNLTKETL